MERKIFTLTHNEVSGFTEPNTGDKEVETLYDTIRYDTIGQDRMLHAALLC